MENDLIKRHTALAVLRALEEAVMVSDVQTEVASAMETIRDVKPVDAIEVIRCKDCDAYGKSPFGHPHIGWCIVEGAHRPQEHYCAYGKRRK